MHARRGASYRPSKDTVIDTTTSQRKPFVAVVTGASSGIGEATARRLAREQEVSLVLVARRERRLRELAESLGEQRASWVAADLVVEDAPAQIREHVAHRHDRLDLLVNNAGARFSGRFSEGGYANVRRTMAINFDAQVRLTEALLPLLRDSAPSAIVNVSSSSAHIARAGGGAYSASKAALAAWSDALWAEERANDVHVGLVLPGFIPTEGFPARELAESRRTRWMLSTPQKVAEAICQAGLARQPERYVPRPYALGTALRALAPSLLRRLLTSGAAAALRTTTSADIAERELDGSPSQANHEGEV